MPAKILEVPEFNKKEVEKISLDRVKQAIDNSEIKVGGGGTKLYKHTVRYNNHTLTIICTNSLSFSGSLADMIDTLFVNAQIISISTDVLSFIYNYDESTLYSFNDNSITSYNIGDVHIDSDTVTEL